MPFKFISNSERFLKIIFGVSLFVVLVMGGVAYRYIKELSNSINDVQHNYQVHIELEKMLSALKDAESGKRGFIISQDSTFLLPLLSSNQQIENSLEELKKLTLKDPQQQENIAELKEKIDKSLAIFEKTLQLSIANNPDSREFIAGFREGRQTMNSVRFKINEMTAHENDVLGLAKEKSVRRLSNAPMLLYYVLILSLLILLLTYLQISKNLKVLKVKNELLETFKKSTTQSEVISKHGNWIWHVEEDVYEYSDNLFRLLGEEPQSFEPNLENYLSFVHPDDVEKLSEHVSQMIEHEDLPFIHYRIIQKNGSIKHFKAYAKILVDADGYKRLLGTTADITDEIENYRLIEKRNLELERSNKELSSFNYVASHDLQEPLRKIQTFLSRLEDKEKDNLSNSGKLYIERIKASSSRMRSLIDDLLQFSRTNKSEEALEDSNINILIEAAKTDLAEIIADKKARIIVDDIPSMRAIPFQIKQLFLNLLSNSLKYSRENTSPFITVSYSKTNASDVPKVSHTKYNVFHTITIMDKGIGFDQDYAEKIFVLFNRLHNKNEYSGTGIGLSICKKIVENHNGYIIAKGEVGVGATFTIYLPIT
ncbi:histidine kinase [Gelidibacter salicanalis]|uniref:histidine kinase n=1 Tax=Gelidibacter salicanalis TaxID=291193 RepID=A0A5C7AJH8_9FLAO|nr:CHASE3 domain-containing protein [Gelidibacter salicanalis]TXE08571.1 histidine kinase [Gelidibacter salicanalis]